MNTNTANRRHFLTTGALLVAGGLVLPSTAVASTTTTGVTPATDADLWAILNRQVCGHYRDKLEVCECHGCATLRATPYVCAACGFDGEPIVYPCECAEDRRKSLAIYATMLAGDSLSSGDRAHVEATHQRIAAEPLPPLCDVRDPYCAHGSVVCPACGDSGSDDPFEGESEPRKVATMLRDLRAALRSRAAT